MKKKNIFLVAFAALTMSIGFSSCKKDKNCATATYDGESECFCVEDIGTRSEFDAYVKYLKSEGYKINYTNSCK